MGFNHTTALYVHSINIRKHIIKCVSKKKTHVLINKYYFISDLQAGTNGDPYTIDVILHMRFNHTTALYVHSINIHTHIIKYISKKI